MQDLFFQFWYLWLLVLLVTLYRWFKPSVKGWIGEKTVAAYLALLPKEEYYLYSDLMLPTNTGTTQIDHIVVSLYGIFVIEVKNYKGWIFGSEKSAQWTQNIYGKKNNFMNPIHQNYAHIKALETILNQYADTKIVSIIAFSPGCDLKVNTTSHVTYFHRLSSLIRNYSEKVLEKLDMDKIATLLTEQNISSPDAKKDHIEMIINKKTEMSRLTVGSKCQKCSGYIVKRQGRNGSFLGCSNYPKCRFTRQQL
jgi:hypothetical protein